MEPHAAGPLHDRLDDDRGDLVARAVEHHVERRERRGHLALAGRHRRPQDLAQQIREGAVEDRVAARGHRAEGIAVVGVVEPDEDAAPRLAALAPLLDRHLHRDLDRGRAVVGDRRPATGRPGRERRARRPGARRARG